jgi:hypothetical protein
LPSILVIAHGFASGFGNGDGDGYGQGELYTGPNSGPDIGGSQMSLWPSWHQQGGWADPDEPEINPLDVAQ